MRNGDIDQDTIIAAHLFDSPLPYQSESKEKVYYKNTLLLFFRHFRCLGASMQRIGVQ
jgi:hypothetical protein